LESNHYKDQAGLKDINLHHKQLSCDDINWTQPLRSEVLTSVNMKITAF
jgi:hypothetical protein